jgi:hypothetical protein
LSSVAFAQYSRRFVGRCISRHVAPTSCRQADGAISHYVDIEARQLS